MCLGTSSAVRAASLDIPGRSLHWNASIRYVNLLKWVLLLDYRYRSGGGVQCTSESLCASFIVAFMAVGGQLIFLSAPPPVRVAVQFPVFSGIGAHQSSCLHPSSTCKWGYPPSNCASIMDLLHSSSLTCTRQEVGKQPGKFGSSLQSDDRAARH